jgi:protein-disulfide isomerase
MTTDLEPMPPVDDRPTEAAPATTNAPDPVAARMRSTPVVGAVMLIVGLLIGYAARPMIERPPTIAQSSGIIQGPQPLPESREEVMPYLISQARHFRGDPNAAVTLIEIEDFQCPFCGLHFQVTEPKIVEAYVATGKVRIGYMHYTFLGQESVWAAEASECAADQDKFWEYHDLLFQNQDGENQGAFNKDKLKLFARSLGLNEETFNSCLDSGKYTAYVTSQTQALSTLGVSSTPTFVIEGQPMVGAQEFDVFQQLLDPLLSQ